MQDFFTIQRILLWIRTEDKENLVGAHTHEDTVFARINLLAGWREETAVKLYFTVMPVEGW
jgi:hypothetical protein